MNLTILMNQWREDVVSFARVNSQSKITLLELVDREFRLISAIESLLDFQHDWALKEAQIEIIKNELTGTPDETANE